VLPWPPGEGLLEFDFARTSNPSYGDRCGYDVVGDSNPHQSSVVSTTSVRPACQHDLMLVESESSLRIHSAKANSGTPTVQFSSTVTRL
jgi:hypothetical protein